jgi:hypothetical protein
MTGPEIIDFAETKGFDLESQLLQTLRNKGLAAVIVRSDRRPTYQRTG